MIDYRLYDFSAEWQGGVRGLGIIPASRKRKASDIFASMVEEDTNCVKNKMAMSVKVLPRPSKTPAKTKKTKKINEVSFLLVKHCNPA